VYTFAYMLLFPVTRMFAWFALTSAGTAFTWLLWQKTHQGWWIAAAGLVGVLISIACAPAAGWLADSRWRKRVLIVSPILSATFYLLVPCASSPVMLLVFGGLAAAAISPFQPAFTAVLLSAFKGQSQVKVLGWTTSAEASGVVAGTVTGGAIMMVSHWAPFILTAICLAGTSVLSCFLPIPKNSSAVNKKEHGNIWAGFRVLQADRILVLMLGSVLFMSISRQLAVVAEPGLVGDLKGNSLTLAFISAAWSVGMIGGGIAAARWAKREHSLTYLWVARLVVSLGMGLNFVAHWLWQPVIAYIICGLAWAWIPVSTGMIIAQRCPENKRGRLLAFQGAIGQAAFAVGIIGSGLCIQFLGIRESFLFAAVVGMLSLPPLFLASKRYKHEDI